MASRRRLAVFACLVLCAASAAAQMALTPVQVAIGPAVYVQPRYPGASSSRAIYFPFLDLDIGGRLYSNASDVLGIYAYKTAWTQVGAALEFDPTRRLPQDDVLLRGLPEIKDTTRFKLFAARTVAFVTLEQNIAADMLGRGQGTLAQTNLWFTAPLTPSLMVNVGPGATLADSRYMHAFFAVSAAEAAANPLLREHGVRAGLYDAHLNASLEWRLPARWRLGTLAEGSHLQGDAADSPVVRHRGQYTVMAWVAYQIR